MPVSLCDLDAISRPRENWKSIPVQPYAHLFILVPNLIVVTLSCLKSISSQEVFVCCISSVQLSEALRNAAVSLP